MRLIQFFIPGNGRRIGVVEDDRVFDLTAIDPDWRYIYDLFFHARENKCTIDEYIAQFNYRDTQTFVYSDLLKHHPGDYNGWILPTLDHRDPAHCIITGTGLTHLGSMAQRNSMHKEAQKEKTDSQKMFEMGLEGGKPEPGARGVSPEWFYKGNGHILRGHNDYLDIPSFTDDGGEEPEIVGCYIIGKDRMPYRLGFAVANEWSDHAVERVNYLWLAPSKLRTCSVGPELLTNQLFKDVRGFCRIYRGEEVIYDSGELLTGEDNMSHSLTNLEDHHFKYPQFRVPGDVHIHFFGTMKLSYESRDKFQNNDRIEVKFDGMGEALVNYIRRIGQKSSPFEIRKG
ncbi:sugar transporter [Candidatus Poribacteria bacterium]|nr:sugar transporter [Candidatus Poribacteria bacterium]